MGYTSRMDELQISGRRYISSRRLAKENGYTADYLGQLIRGGKISGQKVGRAWYVDAESFEAYLGKEGAPLRAETSAPAPEPVEAPAEEVIEEEEQEEVAASVETPEAAEVAEEVAEKTEDAAVETPEAQEIKTEIEVEDFMPAEEFVAAEPEPSPVKLTIKKE